MILVNWELFYSSGLLLEFGPLSFGVFFFFFLTELKCLEIIFLLFFCVRKSKLFEVRPVIKRGEIVENEEQHGKYKTIPNFA